MALDAVTISSLATAGGTLVLAVATFSSTRSANRAARASERSLQISQRSLQVSQRALEIGLRPVLMPSRWDDPTQKIMYGDEQWFKLPGSGAIGEIRTANGVETVYLGISLRNAGSGLAVIHGWRFYPERSGTTDQHPSPEGFHANFRDLYVPVNDVGFWQAAYRDPGDEEYPAAVEAVKARRPVSIDLLYGDHEGGQRVITRFTLTPRDTASAPSLPAGGPGPAPEGRPRPADAGRTGPADGSPPDPARTDGLWLPGVVRHWNLDRPDPR